MRRAYGLEIPQTLDDACDPAQLALIVYDVQVGILRQLGNVAQLVAKILKVLDAAREAALVLALLGAF